MNRNGNTRGAGRRRASTPPPAPPAPPAPPKRAVTRLQKDLEVGLRRATRDAVINPTQAGQLPRYLFDANADRRTLGDIVTLIVGFVIITLVAVATLIVIGLVISGGLALISLAWRFITGS